jgi:hypothetical protein
MKRLVVVASANVTLLSLGIAFSNAAGAQTAAQENPGVARSAQENNTRPGLTPENVAPGSLQPTRGVVFFTAAINSDGSVAGCFGCNPANTFKVAVGRYIVDFGQNIQARNGWSRWVQPDTLQFGQIDSSNGPGAWCNTADSFADSNAVWVNCQHTGGPGSQGKSQFFDTSFFLFVAR